MRLPGRFGYKFFRPHAGVVWGREDLLDRLQAYKVRPADGRPPGKLETGTQNDEAQAGVLAAVEYLAELGERAGSPFADDPPGFQGRRRKLKQAMVAIQVYERGLFKHFVAGLLAVPGLSFYGIQDPSRFHQRTPTAALTWPAAPPVKWPSFWPAAEFTSGRETFTPRRSPSASAWKTPAGSVGPAWPITIPGRKWTTAWNALPKPGKQGRPWRA